MFSYCTYHITYNNGHNGMRGKGYFLKRTLTLLTLLILALSLSGAVGCGRKMPPSPRRSRVDNATSEGGTAAEDSDNGEATDKGGSMTFNDGSGGNTAGGGGGIVTPEAVTEAPDEAELGVPVYPGATLDPDNSATINAGNQPCAGRRDHRQLYHQ